MNRGTVWDSAQRQLDAAAKAMDLDPGVHEVLRHPRRALDRAGSDARIRLDSTAVWVKHDGDPAKSETVTIAYTRGGKTFKIKARSVVMAGGS